ncbi:MAG: hypothetical protein QME81_06900 [bacterium]|nr:hypothetical protein [bacterium]
MGTQVTLTLPNDLYTRAERWATITRRELSETLTDVLSDVLKPICAAPDMEKPVSTLSDQEVVTLSKLQMAPTQGRRLDKLLEKQRESELADEERSKLLALMQTYEQLWIRQSEALAEAVRRGLREPLGP